MAVLLVIRTSVNVYLYIYHIIYMGSIFGSPTVIFLSGIISIAIPYPYIISIYAAISYCSDSDTVSVYLYAIYGDIYYIVYDVSMFG